MAPTRPATEHEALGLQLAAARRREPITNAAAAVNPRTNRKRISREDEAKRQ
ncbi:MAG: hypothetical protein M3R15_25315 [Acidobacteriota bacterium]|nr:hypothetical protein [Acidobacteriota bacterium]